VEGQGVQGAHVGFVCEVGPVEGSESGEGNRAFEVSERSETAEFSDEKMLPGSVD